MSDRPPIYTRYYDLLGWLLDRTAKFPKNMRFGLVQKIEHIALTVLELLVEALYRKDRAALYRPMNLELEKLRVFLRLSHDRGLLSAEQLRYAVGDIWKSMFGWFQFIRAYPVNEGLVRAECRAQVFKK